NIPERNRLWEVMEATYKVLNYTYPNLTEGCWLCYMMRPPFYEAIGSSAEVRGRDMDNPRECLWKQGENSATPGITLEQIRGKGICIG
ncbi:ENV1 protein, partial [Eubucco bourcierii]|nr:ENV1 protein [Eubucco bourcierii]